MITFEQLLLEVSIDQLRRDWVDSGKMETTLFDFLCQCANNQSAYATWLVKRVGDSASNRGAFEGLMTNEDIMQRVIRDYRNWFDLFTKQKQYFEIKDINQYRDLSGWLNACAEVQRKVVEKKAAKDIDRFKIGAVEADGKTYLVYKLPKGHPENRQISIELGRHGDNARGWCTAYDGETSGGYWESHIGREDLYIFVNPQDRLNDKFQIQFGYYEDRPFPVKTDQGLNDEQVKPYMPFYKFLHEKEGRPEKPVFILKAEREAERQRQERERIQAAVEHPTRTLDDCRIHEGVYEIPSTRTENISDWVAPLTQALGLPESARINVAFLRTYVGERSVLFVSAASDGMSDFRVFHLTVNRRRRVRELVVGCSYGFNNYNQRSPEIEAAAARTNTLTSEDTNNQALLDRIKWLAEQSNADLSRDLTRRFHDLLHPRRVSVRAARAQANGRDLDAISRNLGEVSDMSLSTRDANFYEISLDNLHILFDGLENAEDKTTRLRNSVDGTLGIVVQKGIALVLSDLHRGNEYTTAHIENIYQQLIFRIDLATGMLMPNRMNPDTLYTIYKTFKRGDRDVQYPPMIAQIDAISHGSLEEYELDWKPEHVTRLFKVPVEQRSLIPYSLPQSMRPNGYIYLGFISKWQFTLSDTGSFMLTGRWGSAGSRSWINSVPGLAQALISICDRYGIPRAGTLRQLQELCDRCGVEYPTGLREALMQESMKDIEECNQSCTDIWLDYILG